MCGEKSGLDKSVFVRKKTELDNSEEQQLLRQFAEEDGLYDETEEEEVSGVFTHFLS